MAVVYAATHRNQKQVAIKMLHAELSLREDVRQRFLREGYAANSVKHAGALAVLDDDSAEDGSAFLVMELLEGAPVDELWERWDHRFPLEQVLAIGDRLLEVLAAAHERGIVHRDIKPANLFVTREGSLKVLDFGIARVRDAAASSANATGTGMLLGTPAFMSPEQAFAKASEIDEQTDLWAVGATLFTLASGRTVHEGETASEIVIHTATKPARSLGTVAPDLPPRAVSVIDRALAFAKSDRWASAAAMRRAVTDTHAALFGRSVAPEALAVLLSRAAPATATSNATEPLAPTLCESPLSAGGEPRQAPAAAASTQSLQPELVAPVVGSTTARPVASDARARSGGIARRPGLLLGLLSVAVVAGSLSGAIALRKRPTATTEISSATANPALRRQESPRASAPSAPAPSFFTPTVSIDDLPASEPAVRLPSAPRDVAGAASAAATAIAPLRASSTAPRPGGMPRPPPSALPRTGPAPGSSAAAPKPGAAIDDGF